MPALNFGFENPTELDPRYQEFVFNDSQEFEDIRRYSLSNNFSSPSIQSQLSQNPSSPMSQKILSSNSSSPIVTGRISNNTSSPAVNNTKVLGSLETYYEGDRDQNEYGATNISTYENYEELSTGTATLGLNEEEWQIQSLTLQEEIEEAFKSIQEMIEDLEEEIEIKELDEDNFKEITS